MNPRVPCAPSSRLPAAIAIVLIVIVTAGCASRWVPVTANVTVDIAACRTDREFYRVECWTPAGSDLVRFVNHDPAPRRIEFTPWHWPFWGRQHTIVIRPNEASRVYRIKQFATQKAGPDTFFFEVRGVGDPCEGPPSLPGLVSED